MKTGNATQTARIVVAAMLANALILDLLAILLIESSRTPTAGGGILLALGSSQIAIVSHWSVWGQTRLALRLAAWLACLAGWDCILKFKQIATYGEAAMILGLAAVPVLGVAILFRLLGWHIEFKLGIKAEVACDQYANPRQFSVRHIFLITTFLAVLLGLGRILDLPWASMLDNFETVAMIVAATGLPIALLPWVLLTPAWRWLRLLMWLAFTTGSTILAVALFEPEYPVPYVLWYSLSGISSLAMLLALRAVGYRFVRTKRPVPKPLAVTDDR